jgi:hypothetical protein
MKNITLSHALFNNASTQNNWLGHSRGINNGDLPLMLHSGISIFNDLNVLRWGLQAARCTE